MKEEELYALIDEIIPDHPIALTDIPEVDLYIDQVTEFIDNKLSIHKRHQKDKLLTKTMINNYAKAGILMPPSEKIFPPAYRSLIVAL